MHTRHTCSAGPVILMALVIGFDWSRCFAGAQSPEQKDLPERYIQSHSIPPVVERAGVAVIEVAPELTEESRERLRQALTAQGLMFAEERPDGFPRAGDAQQLRQSVWALMYDTTRDFAEVRSQVIDWCQTSGDADVKGGVLGILPGFLDESDRSPVFFRPAHVVVMLASLMPFDRLADSLARFAWLTVMRDSVSGSAFVKYLWRRVNLKVDPAVGVQAALDSLRALPWIRAAAPVLLDWGHLLPVIPRVALMRELAVGTLRKLRPLELVVVAHTCRVDGPEAGVELARSSTLGVDSLGRIRVKIEASASYDRLKPELAAWKAEVVSHEERQDHVVVVALLPVKWIVVCTAAKSVVNIYPDQEAGDGN